MRHIWIIGQNDLRTFLRTRVAYLWVFIMPLVFVYFMGFAIRSPGDPQNPHPAVWTENLDTNFLAKIFLDELGAQGLWIVYDTHRDKAQRGIRIPADFTAKVLREEPAEVELFNVAKAHEPAAALIEVKFFRALIAMNAYLVDSALRHHGRAVLTEPALREAQSKPKPVLLEARFAGRNPMPSGFSFSLPGTLVMYLLLNLMVFGGATVAWERKEGVLRRLCTHPVKKHELLFGKMCGTMLLGVLQIVVVLAAGRFLFGVNLGSNLVPVLATLILFGWVATSIGLVVGFFITAEDKVVGICILTALTMAALGGCWWPLEMSPDFLRVMARCFPTSWAMDALHQVISFGGSLADAREELGILVLFGLVANGLAAKFFRV
jgi:ABC-type multidrug transport system permease subunit